MQLKAVLARNGAKYNRNKEMREPYSLTEKNMNKLPEIFGNKGSTGREGLKEIIITVKIVLGKRTVLKAESPTGPDNLFKSNKEHILKRLNRL